MRHEDLSLLEESVRIANPIPQTDDLVGSEAAARVLLMLREQTAESPNTPYVRPQTRRRGWLRPALVFAVAFVIVLGTIGILAVLRSDSADVVEQPDLVTTSMAPEITEDTYHVTPFAEVESPPSLAWPLNQVLDLAFAPDGSLWAATSGGVVRWDVESETPTVFTEADGLQESSVHGIAVAADGTVWVTAEDWVARYDGTWTSYTEFGTIDDVSINLGTVTAHPGGEAWFWADMSPHAGLLHFDGTTWTAVTAPKDWLVVDNLWAGMAFSLDSAPDGTLWVGSDNGVLAFNGVSWTHHTPANSGLPSPVARWVAVAPDGTVWVGTETFEGDEVRGAVAAAGVAAFDGSTWTTYTTTDGLAANASKVAVGPDGTVWAVADEGISRFDGEGWTSFSAVGRSYGTTVGPDGTLWQPSSLGIAGFDGEAKTSLVVSRDAAPRGIPDLALIPAGQPVTTATPIGDITWYRFTVPAGHGLYEIKSTPHGLVALDGNMLRWSEDLLNWRGTALPIESWRLTTDESRVIVHRDAALWLRWDGDGWTAEEILEVEGNFIEQIVASDQGTVITGDLQILHATDGRTFRRVENAPHPTRLAEDWTDEEGLVGCSYYSVGGWPGLGNVGPVLGADEGFVALTPAHPANWNNEPLCEPVLWYSPDGDSWDLLAGQGPFGEGHVVRDVASHAGRHLAIGADSWQVKAWFSEDAIHWVLLDLPEHEESAILSAVAGSDDGWFILEELGAGWISPDGVTWTRVPDGMPAIRSGWDRQPVSMGHGLIAISGSEELVFGVIEQ